MVMSCFSSIVECGFPSAMRQIVSSPTFCEKASFSSGVISWNFMRQYSFSDCPFGLPGPGGVPLTSLPFSSRFKAFIALFYHKQQTPVYGESLYFHQLDCVCVCFYIESMMLVVNVTAWGCSSRFCSSKGSVRGWGDSVHCDS